MTPQAFHLSIALRDKGKITRSVLHELLRDVPEEDRMPALLGLRELGYAMLSELRGDDRGEPYLDNRSYEEGRYFGAGSITPLWEQHTESIKEKLLILAVDA